MTNDLFFDNYRKTQCISNHHIQFFLRAYTKTFIKLLIQKLPGKVSSSQSENRLPH
jgi:hypothetical protein